MGISFQVQIQYKAITLRRSGWLWNNLSHLATKFRHTSVLVFHFHQKNGHRGRDRTRVVVLGKRLIHWATLAGRKENGLYIFTSTLKKTTARVLRLKIFLVFRFHKKNGHPRRNRTRVVVLSKRLIHWATPAGRKENGLSIFTSTTKRRPAARVLRRKPYDLLTAAINDENLANVEKQRAYFSMWVAWAEDTVQYEHNARHCATSSRAFYLFPLMVMKVCNIYSTLTNYPRHPPY